MCLKTYSRTSKWYLDNGCSRHMTGDHSKFLSLTKKDGGYVTFSGNGKGKIIGIGTISINDNISIDDVLLVQGLKHNLLSISQLSDKGYLMLFDNDCCKILNKEDNSTIFIAKRRNNVYTLDLIDLGECNIKCLNVVNDNCLFWHRRLGQSSVHVLNKISKKELVKDMPKMNFKFDHICEPCIKGKHKKI